MRRSPRTPHLALCLALAAVSACRSSPDTGAIPSEPACPDCRIVLEPGATLGARGGPDGRVLEDVWRARLAAPDGVEP
ncbi:MAG TPA: hypothetical protein VHG51_17805 [Longimicrobiaceae bacterium]|nr:hypothetical protein [Longimicrobiaceae bacterium]